MNTVNMFQLKLLKHLIFFATACSMLLHPLNLLLTNALSAPLWNMPVQFGILILLKTSMLWNLFSVELPVGLPIDMLNELNWPSLQERRKQARLILLYKIVNHLLLVPNRCLPSLNQTATRAHHDQKFNLIQSSVNTYLYSFLPRTIPHWNDLCIPNLSTIDLETFKQSTTPTL